MASGTEPVDGPIPAAEDLRSALTALQEELRGIQSPAAGPTITAANAKLLRAVPAPDDATDPSVPIARANREARRTTSAIDALTGPQPGSGPIQHGEISEILRLAERLASAQAELGAERGLRMAAEARVADLQARLAAAVSKVEMARDYAREAGEQAAFLEGRVASLEETLDQVVYGSLVSRFKWRRALRRGASGGTTAR